MTTTVLTGIVCDNTCLGFTPGDDTPDFFALFGPVFGDLMSRPFELVVDGANFSLTINDHTLNFAQGDPHFSISFTDPLLASFSPGAALFTATGTNVFGIAVAETEFLCPTPFTPAVPEPSTAALFLLGVFAAAGVAKWRKRRG